MDDHRLHAGWASTTLVLSLICPAMVVELEFGS